MSLYLRHPRESGNPEIQSKMPVVLSLEKPEGDGAKPNEVLQSAFPPSTVRTASFGRASVSGSAAGSSASSSSIS